MRAIMVSVNYADILAVTLPYNRHHFDDVMVVTDNADDKSAAIAVRNECRVFRTGAFYDDGAVFNKWKALEQGLDEFGRTGWMCLMDADVAWPKELTLSGYGNPQMLGKAWAKTLDVGKLYTPLRHMMEDLEPLRRLGQLPRENTWTRYPTHRNEAEWAGYSQIFHATDPVLGPAPWHEVNWRHAGGADSFFQRKWTPENKVRPIWRCLHLGPAGMNWCGRATDHVDGTRPADAHVKTSQLRQFVRSRKRGAHGIDYSGEKLP